MPVALAEAVQHARVVGGHQLAVRIEVRDHGDVLDGEVVGDMSLRLLELAEAAAESDLGVVVELLVRKDEDGIGFERVLDFREGRVVEVRQVDAGDFSAEDRRQRRIEIVIVSIDFSSNWRGHARAFCSFHALHL